MKVHQEIHKKNSTTKKHLLSICNRGTSTCLKSKESASPPTEEQETKHSDNGKCPKNEERANSTEDEVKPYQCDKCGKRFRWNFLLEEHFKHNAARTRKSCNICNWKFPCKEHLLPHNLKLHSSNPCIKRDNQKQRKPFLCKKCGIIFPRKFVLIEHELITHKATDNHLQCKLCGYKCIDKPSLLRHTLQFHYESLGVSKGLKYPVNCQKVAAPKAHDSAITESTNAKSTQSTPAHLIIHRSNNVVITKSAGSGSTRSISSATLSSKQSESVGTKSAGSIFIRSNIAVTKSTSSRFILPKGVLCKPTDNLIRPNVVATTKSPAFCPSFIEPNIAMATTTNYCFILPKSILSKSTDSLIRSNVAATTKSTASCFIKPSSASKITSCFIQPDVGTKPTDSGFVGPMNVVTKSTSCFIRSGIVTDHKKTDFYGCVICKALFSSMEMLFKHGQQVHQANCLTAVTWDDLEEKDLNS